MEKHHNGCRDLKDANSRDISFSHKILLGVLCKILVNVWVNEIFSR